MNETSKNAHSVTFSAGLTCSSSLYALHAHEARCCANGCCHTEPYALKSINQEINITKWTEIESRATSPYDAPPNISGYRCATPNNTPQNSCHTFVRHTLTYASWKWFYCLVAVVMLDDLDFMIVFMDIAIVIIIILKRAPLELIILFSVQVCEHQISFCVYIQ